MINGGGLKLSCLESPKESAIDIFLKKRGKDQASRSGKVCDGKQKHDSHSWKNTDTYAFTSLVSLRLLIW